MVDFKTFQEQAVEEIHKRCHPNWQPPDPNRELPFNLAPNDWKWFKRNVPIHAPHLGKLTTQQLRDLFPGPKTRTKIIRTFIWQCWLWIQMGEIPPIQGNIRSLWYQRLEGFMRKHGLIKDEVVRGVGDSDEDRVIETMGEQVALFVEHRIFRYSGAFKFVPSLNSIYKMSDRKPQWFFFTEKVGLWEPLCLDLYKQFANTVMASEGEPSAATLEKIGMELWAMGKRSLLIPTFADYDPWGWWIDASIDSFMRSLGFQVQTWRLVTQDLFTPENAAHAKDFSAIIEKFKKQEENPNPQFKATSKETLIWNWFKLSKGWYGKPVGLHCDVIGEDVRDARIQRFFKEAPKKDPKFPGLLVGAQEPSRLLNRPVFAPLNRLQRKFR